MKNHDLETVATALELARRILVEYIEPGPRDPGITLQRLLEVLDDEDVVKALDRVRRRGMIRLVD